MRSKNISIVFAFIIFTINAPKLSCKEEPAPLFSFVQINDMHVVANPYKPYGKEINNRLITFIKELNEEKNFPMPDFVLVVGDFILSNGDDYKIAKEELKTAREILDDLKCPYMPLMGNHENHWQEGSRFYEFGFLSEFGDDFNNFFFNYKDFIFVMLNNTNGQGNRKNRNQWLERTLGLFKDKPVVVCAHIPFVKMRSEYNSFPIMNTKGSIDGKELKNIAEKYKDNIVAVLSGHAHVTGRVVENGINYITASGFQHLPCDYLYYQVYPDRIQVRAMSIPKEFTKLTNYLYFSSDTKHTSENFCTGTSEERDYEIKLNTDKYKIDYENLPVPAFLSAKRFASSTIISKTKSNLENYYLLRNYDTEYPKIIYFSPESFQKHFFIDQLNNLIYPADIVDETLNKKGLLISLQPGETKKINMMGIETDISNLKEMKTFDVRKEYNNIKTINDKTKLGEEYIVNINARFWRNSEAQIAEIPQELIGLKGYRKTDSRKSLMVYLDLPSWVYISLLPSEKGYNINYLQDNGWQVYKREAFKYKINRVEPPGGYDIYRKFYSEGVSILEESREDGYARWVQLGVIPMTDVIKAEDSLNKFYRVAVGSIYWSDRIYTINSIPEGLMSLFGILKPCHQKATKITIKRPAIAYAAFLPFDRNFTEKELYGLGWKLHMPRAFEGVPYPGAGQFYSIYEKELNIGENILEGPREETKEAWVSLGIKYLD